jgi:hypothetical protein
MVRRTLGAVTFALWAIAICSSLPAQTEKTITIRMLDSRTGHLIVTSDFLVRINHEETAHGSWVKQNEDGSGRLILPEAANILSAQGKYDSGMTLYINCDSAKDKNSPVARWYTVSDILTSGVVASNGCSKRTAAAKPGEFVFFVRERNWKEILDDYTN